MWKETEIAKVQEIKQKGCRLQFCVADTDANKYDGLPAPGSSYKYSFYAMQTGLVQTSVTEYGTRVQVYSYQTLMISFICLKNCVKGKISNMLFVCYTLQLRSWLPGLLKSMLSSQRYRSRAWLKQSTPIFLEAKYDWGPWGGEALCAFAVCWAEAVPLPPKNKQCVLGLLTMEPSV